MRNKETKSWFFNTITLTIAGIVLLFSAMALLWYGNAHSTQSEPAMVAGVYFDGEYRIADGRWQAIENGKHIVTVNGNKCIFDSWDDAWGYIVFRRTFKF